MDVKTMVAAGCAGFGFLASCLSVAGNAIQCDSYSNVDMCVGNGGFCIDDDCEAWPSSTELTDAWAAGQAMIALALICFFAAVVLLAMSIIGKPAGPKIAGPGACGAGGFFLFVAIIIHAADDTWKNGDMGGDAIMMVLGLLTGLVGSAAGMTASAPVAAAQ
jgi:hypothetical protein